jgi:hypothetical protein
MDKTPNPVDQASQPDTNKTVVVNISAKLKRAPDVPIRAKE